MRLGAIKIACEAASLLSIHEMTEFQDNLKSLSKENYERLKKEILETGMAFPIYIWRSDGKCYVVGGTQRKRALEAMEKEGYEVPRIPVAFVEARNRIEAKRRVLQDISQYGKIEKQELYQFIHDSELGFDLVEANFDLPDLDMESFKFEYYSEPAAAAQNNDEEQGQELMTPPSRAEDPNPVEAKEQTYLNNTIKQIVLFYEHATFESIINKANLLLEKLGLEDFSTLFLALIEKEDYYADNRVSLEKRTSNEGAIKENAAG